MFYVKAYYWRGIAKFKMQNMKGIVDLNQSLALDTDLWQVIFVSFFSSFSSHLRYFVWI